MIDITGKIYNGMWNYEEPFPRVHVKPLPSVDWVDTCVYCEIFDGLHSQTGTYLETPAHLLGDKSYMLEDVDIARITNVDAVVLKLQSFPKDGVRRAITSEMLKQAEACHLIQEGDAILVCADWGQYWYDEGYLANSPYFTADAIDWVIQKRPSILGSDFPRWENLEHPEGFFPAFYDADILMLAPCIHLEHAELRRMKLTALPINISGTCCAPCRAVIW